ncbi:FAD dependent oxidoreductase-domain-containing protein [Mycena rebaudengoi]|nr:FAD dependent oxidoreductase-domain-containing protein [Mycena rebaudengoi]
MGSSQPTTASAFDRIEGGKAFPIPTGMSLSYWLQGVRASPLLDHRTTEELPKSADVVIIGSGLLEHELETWSRLIKFVHEEKVDCELWVGDTTDVAMSPEVASTLSAAFEACKASGGKVDHIKYISDPVEAEKVLRLKCAQAVWAWKASTFYPWKLVAYIMRKCLSNGLNLQTWTPVTSITASTEAARLWDVHTARGAISTPTVVYATNAYTSSILPSFERYIQPTVHMCNKVVLPRAFAGSKVLQNSYSILAARGGHYSINPRCNADGILLFGGNAPNQKKLNEYLGADPTRLFDDSLSNFQAVTDAVNELTSTAFEGWDADGPAPGVGAEYSWSGILGWSADILPFIGKVPDLPGQWICAGFHGQGMPHIFTCAPGLVTLMQGGTLTAERLARIHVQKPVL